MKSVATLIRKLLHVFLVTLTRFLKNRCSNLHWSLLRTLFLYPQDAGCIGNFTVLKNARSKTTYQKKPSILACCALSGCKKKVQLLLSIQVLFGLPIILAILLAFLQLFLMDSKCLFSPFLLLVHFLPKTLVVEIALCLFVTLLFYIV